MDWSDLPTGGKPSPRRELQGPRPAPLKVRKDSHKIKKPPIVPQAGSSSSQVLHQHQHQQQQQQQQQQTHHQAPQQQRQPVIIYTVSPKVIHTNASEFMSLVQRLTGSSTSTSTSTSSTSPISHTSGAISPAARFATIEKTKMSPEGEKSRFYDNIDMIIEELDMTPNVERTKTSSFPGILSPVPSTLPIVSPSFFSPPSDHNSFNFLHDLSPMFNGNKNYFDGNFMPSPNSNFLSAPITSPNLPFDLFNQFLDF
ncbi:mks1 [Thalictrum thalictroides]|uniref:Mks1 n=1 Tax=Thalictrum thalictroides TaxID=46969 RepID=A0A7J6UW85_THATH|nr:mks1 [Thalictrum thalictroides]